MGEDRGGAGFGFAPRSGSDEKKPEGGPTASAAQGFPDVERKARPSVAPASYQVVPQRTPWAWLIMGLLIGVGGTLLTSPLWLSAFGMRYVADVEAIDGQLEPDFDDADATKSEVADIMERWQKTEIVPAPATAVEPERAPAEVADETVDLGDPGIEEVGEPSGDDTVLAIPSERLEVEAPTPLPASATPVTAVEQDVAALEEDDEELLERPTSGPHAAVAALLETEPRTAEAGPPSDDGTSAESDEGPIDRDEDPVVDSQGSDDPTASEDADPLPPTPVARADVETGPNDEDTTAPASTAQSTEIEQAELSSRIRQALQAAAAERKEAATSGGTDGEASAEPATTAARPFHVQLAAVDDEVAAEVFWREVNERLPGVFTDVEPIFSPVGGEEGAFLRVWVGIFDSLREASGYCDGLKDQGQDCFVTRSDTL